MIDRVTRRDRPARPGRRFRRDGREHPRGLERRPRARWPSRRGRTRFSSAGTAAWRRCSAGSTRRPSRRAAARVRTPPRPAAADSQRLTVRPGLRGRALRQARATGARHRPAARAQSVGIHLSRHTDLSRRRATSSRSSIPAPTCRSISTRCERRSAAARSRRSCAPTPTATTARRRDRWPSGPALRSSAARRLRSKRSARAPTPRSTATIGPTACLQDGETVEVDGRRDHCGRDAGPHIEPPVLRLARRPVHRRPCHGLVDDRGRPAGRRHGRLHARASTSFGGAKTASIIRRTGQPVTNPQQYVAPPDRATGCSARSRS